MNVGHIFLYVGFGAYLPLYKSMTVPHPNITTIVKECSHSLHQAGLLEISVSFLSDIAGIIVTATISKKMGRISGLRIFAFYNLLTAAMFLYKRDANLEYVIILSFILLHLHFIIRCN